MGSWPLILMGVTVLVMMIFSTRAFKLWIQSVVSGASINFFRILFMRFRKIDADLIVNHYIIARKVGLPITVADLETHDLAGGNIPRVVLSLVEAKKNHIELDFATATAIDLSGRDIVEEINAMVNSRRVRFSAGDEDRFSSDGKTTIGIQQKALPDQTLRTVSCQTYWERSPRYDYGSGNLGTCFSDRFG